MRKEKLLKKNAPELFSSTREGKAVKVFFEDEARFGRINNVSRCWVPPHQRAEVKQQMVREHVYAFTAVCPISGETYSFLSPLCNTEAMNELLRGFSKQYEQDQIVLIVDGAGWHKSKDLVVPPNISISMLPPYSPQLNPTEHIWDYIREQKKFNNYIFDSLDALEDHLFEVLKNLKDEKQCISSLCTFHWMLNSS
jgi:transposase